MSEVIKLERVEISAKEVCFMSSHTVYVNEIKIPALDVKDLLKRCTLVCKQLKSLGCVVSHKYKTRKELKDNLAGFEKELQDYNHNWSMMQSYATWVTSKPLLTGTADNAELNSMYDFRNKVIQASNRNTLLSKALDFHIKLTNLEQQIEDEDLQYTKVCF